MSTETISPNSIQQNPKRRFKFWIFFLGALLLGALAVPLGIHLYPKFQQKRLLRNAQKAFDRKEYASSVLFARRAVQANPNSVEASRFMADLAEKARSPEMIYWHRRVAKLEPEVLENHLAFARVALQANKPDVAQEAIAGVPESEKKSAAFHATAASVSMALNKSEEAESHLVQAVALEPNNQAYQLNLAVLRIRSSDAAVQSQARANLEKLLSNPTLRGTALRWLIQDSINTRDWDKAVARGRELGDSPDAPFDNKLVNLTLLNRLKHRDFTAYLTHLQEDAAGDPQKLYTLIRWMNNNGFALLAIEWCKHLPSDIVSTMPVPMALAQAYVVIGDWTGLSPIIGGQYEGPNGDSKQSGAALENQKAPPDWADFDYMRLALRARTFRDHGALNESRAQWNAAVKAASEHPETLATLERVAVDFKWKNEATDILWMLARGTTDPKTALKALYDNYAAQQSTRDLLRVVARMYEIDPTDPWTQNNLANYYMLLEDNTAQGIKLAEELHKKEPDNPVYISTYAFALHLQGHSSEAVDAMKSLGQDRLQQPEYAAYYGVILAAAGQSADARKSLDLAKNATLLPEEKKLVDAARRKIGMSSSSDISSREKTQK